MQARMPALQSRVEATLTPEGMPAVHQTMKPISESSALEKLHRLKTDFASLVRAGYEHRAKECLKCETPGACCLDAHFVNVHISRLEARAIQKVIEQFPRRKQKEVFERIEETISKYDLSSDEDTFAKTYACPLFEKGTGCLVHERGKPLPCIAHACYENKEDLPHEDLIAKQEGLVGKLNEAVYLKQATWMPLPVAIRSYAVERTLTREAIAKS